MSMTDKELRLECLRLAAEKNGPSGMVDAAQSYLEFVQGMVSRPSSSPSLRSQLSAPGTSRQA